MGKVEKISVALTPAMAKAMRAVVHSGEYASASEVMREALRAWETRRAARAHAAERLGEFWDEGVTSGAALDGDLAFASLRQKFAGR